MSTKKPTGIEDVPVPPLPKWALPKDDPEYAPPEVLKPDDVRARLQLLAVVALDTLEWHARNMRDPRSSIAASDELLDRAGYVAPAKGKADAIPMGGSGGGEVLPSIEDDVQKMSEGFQCITQSEESE